MPEHANQNHPDAEHPDWSRPLPEVVPEATPWPAALSLGSTLFLWGLISSLIITYVGIALFAVSLAYWIGDIRHERRNTQDHSARPTA